MCVEHRRARGMVVRMDSLPGDLSSATLFQFVGTITKEPDQVQERVLSAILEQNEGCGYLLKHGFRRGKKMDNRATFKARLPVIEYEDIREDIQRIAQGDKSPLLCQPPISEFFTSSGTSGGARKFFPSVAGDKFRKNVNDAISIAFLDREVPGLQQGKALYLFTVRKSIETKSGLLAHTVLTRAFKDIFAPGAVNPYRGTVTSPGEVFLCPEENNQVIYCHLLCALLQRHAVVRVRAIFASFLVRAFRYFLEAWPAMCQDIRHGKLHPRVKDPAMRAAVEELLAVPNPRLADEVEAVMSVGGVGFEALITRLFPNARIVEGITTGSMAAYLSMLEELAGGLPIISMHYGASEGYFGVNLDPLCPPTQVKYTIMPFLNFFEFIPMRRDPVTWETHPALDGIVDFGGVAIGQDYELVVTTFTGLYRYRVGDILRVTGFYNKCPQFEFVGRKNVVLSIDTDKTEEADLHHALTAALDVLQAQLREHKVHTQLLDYSSLADVDSNPGHYVIFVELSGLGDKTVGGEWEAEDWFRELCVQFCHNMERHLSCIYTRNRHEGIIGPLELRLVTEGSFDLLASAAVARGAEIGQYKTPRCLKVKSDVGTLNSRVQMQGVFSAKLP